MGFTVAQLTDLLNTTREAFPQKGWVDLSAEYQDYLALNKLIRKEKLKIRGGDTIDWIVQLNQGEAAQDVGTWETAAPTQPSLSTKASIRWGGLRASMSFDLIELAMNAANETRIEDLLAMRRNGRNMAIIQAAEDRLWNCAATDDGKRLYSIFYWITKKITGTSATMTISGGEFAGPAPFSGTGYTKAGINDAKFTNWTQKWATFSKDNVITVMRNAYWMCQFKSQSKEGRIVNNGDSRYGIYVDKYTMDGLIGVGEAQNDNLGRDLDKLNGQLLFNGIPVTWVPASAGNADWVLDHRIVGIDWNVWDFPVLLGYDFDEGEPMPPTPNQPTVSTAFTHAWCNTRCLDPRKNFLLAVA